MKLRHIHIQNFRGIKNLELDLDDLTVLIGENNVGKTAILHAIRICLRDLGPRRRVVFDTFDFHLKDVHAEPTEAEPIEISLTFAEDKAGDWDAARQRRLRGIVHLAGPESDQSAITLYVRCSYNPIERDFDQTWEFFNEKREPLQGKSEASLAILQREVAFYLLDALRDARRNFDAKGPFWRPFLKDNQLSTDKRSEIEARLKEVNELVVHSHESFGQARTQLEKIQKVVPMQAGEVVSIEAVPGRAFDMLAKAQVNFGTTTGAKLPVDRHGEGTQSLAVLMLFAASLELNTEGTSNKKSPIIALEEPEAHLHPSAIRSLSKTIEGIPGQKLISTHSGDLLSQVPVTAIRRLAHGRNGVEIFRLKADTLDEKERRMFNFHIRHARGELLFARCWLLGEGETEITLFHGIASHLDIDLEREGVRCVPYRLGASLELFLKVARDFGIQCCVLTDNDYQGKKDQELVQSYEQPFRFLPTLHMMHQEDIEEYLCSVGFGPVYEAYLTSQTREKITVSQGDDDYYPQVLKAVQSNKGNKRNKISKPAAALEVVQQILDGQVPVPPLLQAVIKNSVKLARGA